MDQGGAGLGDTYEPAPEPEAPGHMDPEGLVCPECGAISYPEAGRCPDCGAPRSENPGEEFEYFDPDIESQRVDDWGPRAGIPANLSGPVASKHRQDLEAGRGGTLGQNYRGPY